MRTRKVVLAGRYRDANGKQSIRTIEFKRGRPERPEGVNGDLVGYYVRFWRDGRRQVMPAGKDLTEAAKAYRNVELNHTRMERGLAPIEGDAGLLHQFKSHARDDNRTKIADAVERYLNDLSMKVETKELSADTLRGYRDSLEDFRDSCGVVFMEEITADALKACKLHLFKTLRKNRYGKRLNTVAKRFRRLSTFLGAHGIKLSKDRSNKIGDTGLMAWVDVPREEKKQNIDKYSEDEIKGMLKVANVDEVDLIHTFLRTGCRDEEVAHLQWRDIDWRRRQITIDEKPQYEWRPKDKEKRVIPLDDGVLLDRLRVRMERQSPKSDLVFPNRNGSPDKHLIRQLHKVIAKMKERGLVEIEGVPTLHRFRRTYASIMIAHSDLQTVSKLLGHSDIETTSRYLAPDDSRARQATRTAFNGLH